jgi:hypothetical protein
MTHLFLEIAFWVLTFFAYVSATLKMCNIYYDSGMNVRWSLVFGIFPLAFLIWLFVGMFGHVGAQIFVIALAVFFGLMKD